MPIEFRFDDLDLREEPASETSENMDGTIGCTNTYTTCNTYAC
jgi:hypothetical protein